MALLRTDKALRTNQRATASCKRSPHISKNLPDNIKPRENAMPDSYLF